MESTLNPEVRELDTRLATWAGRVLLPSVILEGTRLTPVRDGWRAVSGRNASTCSRQRALGASSTR